MKKHYKLIILIILVALLLGAVAIVFFNNGGKKKKKNESLEQVKVHFSDDLEAARSGKYSNLIIHDFNYSMSDIEALYYLEIQSESSYKEKTFLENFNNMDKVIDSFFKEEIDKSYLEADFSFGENTVYISYDDILKVCTEEKYNTSDAMVFLFGNKVSEGKNMIQTSESLTNTWLSRGQLGAIGPFHKNAKKSFLYVAGERQCEDEEISFGEEKVKLSELEKEVLEFCNMSFPLPVSEGITYNIGQALEVNGANGKNGITFQMRRVYKGVPFEFGCASSEGMYNDPMDSDTGEVTFASPDCVDTMVAFGRTNGLINETKEISEMVSLESALDMLSEQIGANSVYDIYGIELAYRSTTPLKDMASELDGILSPVWKVIAKNQNDDKYTLFYIKVDTGEITQRFEYCY